MAAIVVITHPFAQQMFTAKTEEGLASNYMLGPILVELARRGHRVTLVSGPPREPIAGDLAILHVDLTVVPPEYLEFAASFPVCINATVADLSKRRIADELVQPGSDWAGPVIVKTDLNYRGMPERMANENAQRLGASLPFPNVPKGFEYLTFDNVASVPGRYWRDERFVVQKFLPERVEDGFGVRFWTFLGSVERCDLCVSSSEMVKAATMLRLETSPVPEEVRFLRRRLGLDYGKIDFVLHDGSPVVIDVNKTPGRPPAKKGSDWPSRYADGVPVAPAGAEPSATR